MSCHPPSRMTNPSLESAFHSTLGRHCYSTWLVCGSLQSRCTEVWYWIHAPFLGIWFKCNLEIYRWCLFLLTVEKEATGYYLSSHFLIALGLFQALNSTNKHWLQHDISVWACPHPTWKHQERNGWPQDQGISFSTFTSLSINFPVTPSAHHSNDVQWEHWNSTTHFPDDMLYLFTLCIPSSFVNYDFKIPITI